MPQDPTPRAPLTDEQLERLTVDEYLGMKLTPDERTRLRAINAAREREREDRAARVLAEERPIVEELEAAGVFVDSTADLLPRAEPYPEAIPVLLKHLQLPYSDTVKSVVARALAIPEPAVRAAWPALVRQYVAARTGLGPVARGDVKDLPARAKYGLACALAVAVTDDTLDDLITLLRDPAHGDSRVLLLEGLRRSKHPKARVAIAELADDPDLRKEIASWRRKRP